MFILGERLLQDVPRPAPNRRRFVRSIQPPAGRFRAKAELRVRRWVARKQPPDGLEIRGNRSSTRVAESSKVT